MANKIILKKSSVVGKVPLATDLEIGELAVNLADATLYSKNSSGTVISVGGGGSGDVVGPASSTDNALVRFDGTTGKLIQNGTVTQDDSGNLAGVNAISFATSPSTPPTAPGSLYWDSADGNQTLSLVMASGTATQQIGEEQYYRIKASSAITNGQVVMFTGTVGASGALTGAPATGLTASTASYVMGIATQDIAANGWGYITSFGLVRGLDTSAFTAGDILYLNPAVAGGLTTTIPSAPNPKVQVCACIYSSASVGSLFVRPSFGGALGQYEGDVGITSPSDGQLLIRNQTAGKWVNAALSAGTGISVTNSAGAVTIANTGVTLVGATAPIASSGGATPTISISQSSSTTDGYLSSTDWNTFNNKTSNTGTVTSVAMTVPTGLSVSGTPITTSGTLALTLTTGYSIPTTASQTNWDSAYTQRLQWDGGSTNLVAATGRSSLGGTTVGQNFFTLANPAAITFPRINADNTVSALDAATFRTAIGAGTGSGTVTSVTGTSPVASSGGTTPAISLASAYGDTQNPYGSKTANYVLAAPNGTAGSPTFRAIVAADIPTLNQNTTGSAGSVANSVTFNNGGAGDASGAAFNGSAAKTVSYNTVGAPSTTGTNASGTWGISISGNAATATSATSAGNADTVDSLHAATSGVAPSANQLVRTDGNGYTFVNYINSNTANSENPSVSQVIVTNGSDNYYRKSSIASFTSAVQSNASGTWGINISGNAATATTASNGGVTSVNGSTGAVTVSGGQFFGTAATKAIAYNANSISENITITAGNNGLSAGPITINTSYTVTVATGANWVIV